MTKTVLEKYNITDTLELTLKKSYMILKPKQEPRKGWEKSFKKMHENGDDKLVVPDVFGDEKFEEWN